MAHADYTHCDVCDCKVYYDANVDYDWNLGSMAVLCKECSKTHETIVRKKDEALEGNKGNGQTLD